MTKKLRKLGKSKFLYQNLDYFYLSKFLNKLKVVDVINIKSRKYFQKILKNGFVKNFELNF